MSFPDILSHSVHGQRFLRMKDMIAPPLSRWWWSIDRKSVYAFGALILIGIVLSFAAGPPAAARIGIDNPFHFVQRQAIFLVPGLAIMFAVTWLTPLQVKRFGVLIFMGALILMAAALVVGPEINGAQRWLTFGSFSLQPSEFAKPGFVIAAAWLIAEGARDKSVPGGFIAFAFYTVMAALLLSQPDYGQWGLITMVWAVMFFIAGWSVLWLVGLAIAGIGAVTAGYFYTSHVASRIDRFLNPASGDTYQVDKAREALTGGGMFGSDFGGRADGVKEQLPDAHTDFIFAVAGEEFGLLLCALILGLYAFIVLRAFYLAANQRSIFIQCAVCGLASIIGFQAMINIGVNLQVLPAKGMTLPFISYGGSSLLATGITVGFILALTRKRPEGWRRREVMP